jgi:hypothetical protein
MLHRVVQMPCENYALIWVLMYNIPARKKRRKFIHKVQSYWPKENGSKCQILTKEKLEEIYSSLAYFPKNISYMLCKRDVLTFQVSSLPFRKQHFNARITPFYRNAKNARITTGICCNLGGICLWLGLDDQDMHLNTHWKSGLRNLSLFYRTGRMICGMLLNNLPAAESLLSIAFKHFRALSALVYIADPSLLTTMFKLCSPNVYTSTPTYAWCAFKKKGNK